MQKQRHRHSNSCRWGRIVAKDLRSEAAQHIASTLGARYDVIYHNLGYASPGLIQWASSADEASLQATARIGSSYYASGGNTSPVRDSRGRFISRPEKRRPPVYATDLETYVNPLWYHSSVS